MNFQSPPTFSALSTRYVKCVVSTTENGVKSDPTTGTVDFAFVLDGIEPTVLDWKVGSWETATDEYLGRCLVGPSGTVTLSAGSYDVWVRFTKSPETVIEKVGYLVIY